jgi:23S rRNA A1618 N6-methylase RlmF
MIYEEGGEVGFIKKMIDESIIIGKRIKYFLKIYTI